MSKSTALLEAKSSASQLLMVVTDPGEIEFLRLYRLLPDVDKARFLTAMRAEIRVRRQRVTQ